ncbi:hypothetical protein Mmah_1440 [Methanohalophilus mahii DSM 5219]|uniref:Uncharacterized protein n=1 Tax=Methanohalophilus mahii (strain ATCC 35705 / DSM 5219 / SLP) TaxID=547558 RepID=D5E700_METMS|nr:hypothetical protein Mmah_1440 [Methanohalophilus mahii DSM 5219]
MKSNRYITFVEQNITTNRTVCCLFNGSYIVEEDIYTLLTGSDQLFHQIFKYSEILK